jgi:hypothetical protein
MQTTIKDINLLHYNIIDFLIKDQINDLIEYLPNCSVEFQAEVLQQVISKISPLAINKNLGDGWFTATQIAKELNISKQKFGRLVKELNIKDNPKLCKSFIIKVSNMKYSKVYFYKYRVKSLISKLLKNKTFATNN